MKVSIVLTTYNGEKFLYDLLESLKNQTYSADEVIICDDGSTDGTQHLLSEYIEKNQLNNWRICINSSNKGWKKNFRDGIFMTNGDLVFPCDQDDIWESNKIRRMIDIMMSNENIMLLSSDYRPLYEEGGQKVEKTENNNIQLEQITFDSHFAFGRRPGCTMCVRRKLINEIRPIWEDWYPHDVFLWTMAVFINGCYILHEPLIMYRRHSGNATNHETRNKKAVISSLKRNLNIVDYKLKAADSNLSEEKINTLNRYKQYAKLRLELLEGKKIINFLKLFQYREFYKSLKQEMGDLYLFVQ